jgi:hypothetical protein
MWQFHFTEGRMKFSLFCIKSSWSPLDSHKNLSSSATRSGFGTSSVAALVFRAEEKAPIHANVSM